MPGEDFIDNRATPGFDARGVRRIQRVVRRVAAARPVGLSAVWIALFFAAHVLLAHAMNTGFTLRASKLGTMHLLLTALVGVLVAAFGKREYATYVGAYIVGAEVLWRMGRVAIFYEFGKYALILVFAIGLIRARNLRLHWLAITGFALLLPSAMLTLSALDVDLARKHLSFNLSGPLALMVAVCFFCNIKLTRRQLCIALMAYMGSSIGAMSLALIRLAQWSQWIRFTTDSNPFTSGGFGPNQVSAVLGLGCLCGFLCLLFAERIGMRVWAVLFVATLGLAGQSAMTFSRGGLYCAAASGFFACVALMDKPKFTKRMIIFGALGLVLGLFVIIPRLDRFTQGTLTSRFESVDVTKRDVLVRDELGIWMRNPLFGVGPGMVGFNRKLIADTAPAHTEFSRLVAEHGLFGAIDILILAFIALRTISSASSREERAIRLTGTSWAVFFMLINGMRVAAPSFMFGLAFVSLIPVTSSAYSRRVLTTVRNPRRVLATQPMN